MYLGQLTIIILLFFRANNCMANVGTYSVYTPLLTSSPYAVSGPVSALTYGRSVEIYHPRQQFSTYYSAATPLTAPAMHYLSTQSFVNSLPNRNPLVSDVAASTLTKSVMVREPVKDVKGPTPPITPSVLAVSSASAAAVVPASKQAAEYDSSSAFVAPPVSLPAPTSSSNPSTSYDFSYSVHDSLSGDIKSQVETRQGGNVRGAYSVLDADGYRRTVAYSADDLNGFNAVVQREPFVAKLTDIVNVMDAGHEPTTFSVPVQDFKFLSQPSGQQVAFVQQPQQQNEPQSILSQLPESLVSDEKQQQQQHQSTYPQDQQFPPQHHQLEKDDNQQLEQHHHHQQQQQQQHQETGEELSSNPSSNFDDSDVLEVRLATKIDDQKRNPKI